MSEIPEKLLEVIRSPEFAERVGEACLKMAGDLDAEKVNRFHPLATIIRIGDQWIIDRFRTELIIFPALIAVFSVIPGILAGFLKGVSVGLLVGGSAGAVVACVLVWSLIRHPENRRFVVSRGNRWVLDGADHELNKFSGFVVMNVVSESWGKRAEFLCLVGVSRSGRIVPLAIGTSVLLIRILTRLGDCVLDGRDDLKNPAVWIK